MIHIPLIWRDEIPPYEDQHFPGTLGYSQNTKLMIFPPIFTIIFLIFSWLIWLLCKWRSWPRPSVSIMLVCSTSIASVYVKTLQGLEACLLNPLCDLLYLISLFPFLTKVSFWLIVLYLPIALATKPKIIFDHKKQWWLAIIIIALAARYITTDDSLLYLRILSTLIDSDRVTISIIYGFTMLILIPWLIWLLLKISDSLRPALPTMFMYSISTANAFSRFFIEWSICTHSRGCDVDFSLTPYLVDIVVWFILLYAIMKLITRTER